MVGRVVTQDNGTTDGRPTLGERLGNRDNALNFVRLALATVVIVSHMWLIDDGEEAFNPMGDAAVWAVYGFFAASGYLIMASRLRLRLGRFLWHRVLRIYPAFWVALILTAFVIAPLSTHFTGAPYALVDGVDHVVRNMSLHAWHLSVGSTLEGATFPDIWNGSLWTLIYEFAAYILVGLAFCTAFVRRHTLAATLTLFITSLVVWNVVLHGLGEPETFVSYLPKLFTYFAAGALFFVLRDRMRVAAWQGPVLLAVCVVLWMTGWAESIGQLPFAALILWAGAWLPIRLGASHDLSYGMYVYGFPLQQLLVASGVTAVLGTGLSAIAAVAVTMPLAAASWKFIERPALRMKSFSPSDAVSRLVSAFKVASQIVRRPPATSADRSAALESEPATQPESEREPAPSLR